MSFPSASDLAASLAAIADVGERLKAAGFTHIRLGSMELRLAPPPPQTPGQQLVDEINKQTPLPAEPVDVLRRAAARELAQAGYQPTIDLQEAIANGARLVDTPAPQV